MKAKTLHNTRAEMKAVAQFKALEDRLTVVYVQINMPRCRPRRLPTDWLTD